MGLYRDAKSIAARDPAARNTCQVIFLYSGFHALALHRIAHWFCRHKRYLFARSISQFNRFLTGVEIHPAAKIGAGLFIDHGMGVVIGETAEVGQNCTIYHGVTLGGTGREKGKRHPTLGDNVLVGAGAKILGPFRVGDNAMIGANAVVLREVPDNSTVVGVPGHVIKMDNRIVRHNIELDHNNSPDPVEQELCRLLQRVTALEKQIGMASVARPGSSIKRKCPENDQLENGIPADSERKTSGGSDKHENI